MTEGVANGWCKGHPNDNEYIARSSPLPSAISYTAASLVMLRCWQKSNPAAQSIQIQQQHSYMLKTLHGPARPGPARHDAPWLSPSYHHSVLAWVFYCKPCTTFVSKTTMLVQARVVLTFLVLSVQTKTLFGCRYRLPKKKMMTTTTNHRPAPCIGHAPFLCIVLFSWRSQHRHPTTAMSPLLAPLVPSMYQRPILLVLLKSPVGAISNDSIVQL